MSAGHSVTFFLYDQEGVISNSNAINAMREFWSEFVIIPHKKFKRKKTNGRYWGIDDWFNEDIESAIKFLALQNNYDAVICEYVFLSKALTLFDKHVIKILNCHDRMSNRADLLQRNGLLPDFFYTTPDQEKNALDRADLILAIQGDEKCFFQSITKKCVVELGHPFDVDIIQLNSGQTGVLRVGYLGSANSLNIKSLEVFLTGLWNRRDLKEKVKLVVAGNICKVIDDPNIKCLGFVEDERNFFNEIDLFINPMIDGTGLKIKTLSALRHGFPFIATAPASIGLPTSTPEHTCKSVENLIDYLEEIVCNPQERLPELRNASLICLEAYKRRIDQQINGLLRLLSTRSIAHLRRKRVLLVTDIPFWEPGVGSHSRIFSLYKALQTEFDCQVFFYGSIWPDRLEEIENSGLKDIIISYKNYESCAINVSFHADEVASARAKWAYHEIFGKSLAQFLGEQDRYDAVIFEYLWLAYLRSAIPYKTISILDTHDLMAPREYRCAIQGLRTRFSISLMDEVAILEKFDVIIAIQNEEASWMERLLPSKIVLCCPHGVEVENETLPGRLKLSRRNKHFRIGFVGGGSNENAEAIRWFLREIWPVVRQLNIELHIYGNVCEKLRDQSLDSDVTLHGLLASLDVAYAHCDAIINPIMHGGGLKIKSVEAIAHGKPLIASPEGAVGIENAETSGIIIARSRGEFINAVLRLASNPNECDLMSHQAISAAKKQFSLSASFSPLVALLGSL